MRPAPSLRREEASGAESNSDRLMRCGLSHKQRHTHGRRGKPPSPAPWVLTGPQPRPQPPPDPGLPPTGRGPRPPPSCPERGLPVLPGPPAAASWPVLAPGVSTLPAGALGLHPPGPSGLQLELRVSWAPRVQVGAPPRHGHPTRAGSLAPGSCSAALCALCRWPPGRGVPGRQEAHVCPPTPDIRGFSPPGPAGLALWGPLGSLRGVPTWLLSPRHLGASAPLLPPGLASQQSAHGCS